MSHTLDQRPRASRGTRRAASCCGWTLLALAAIGCTGSGQDASAKTNAGRAAAGKSAAASGSGGGVGSMCSADSGGPVVGATDAHCIDLGGQPLKQRTSEAACLPPANVAAPHDHANTSAHDHGGGSVDGGLPEEAPVLYGSEGDDDDCKYHLKWTASCVAENTDVTFRVTVTKKFDDAPLTGAKPDLEVFLSDTHPAPTTVQKPKETAAGEYTAGPIRFDAPGRWTVRFHLRGECVDLTDDSPHGHVAFYVDVP